MHAFRPPATGCPDFTARGHRDGDGEPPAPNPGRVNGLNRAVLLQGLDLLQVAAVPAA
jgi:hypothetical protein